jgi:hypothetical protein
LTDEYLFLLTSFRFVVVNGVGVAKEDKMPGQADLNTAVVKD